ncbi:MAG: sigma-54-dependent Fis family transcriptional regulator [Candidatus Delongbacteria bacterium]|nr:sigma-54-dependent Fis family transcriptional regulator [Candidatus Delongbacteria bacterium]
MNARILIVDDDAAVCSSLGLLLKQSGYRVSTAATPGEALEAIASQPPDCVIQDMNFSRRTDGEEGIALLARTLERQPGLPVILITAWASVSMAVQGIKAGAADFITKPWSHEQVRQSVATALGLKDWRNPASSTRSPSRAQLDAAGDFSMVVGEDPALLALLDIVARTAHTEASVLITGESGSGKEVIADAIRRNSARRDGPMVKVNLGGLSGPLFDSELFGHVRGAFTDARSEREGRFERAQGGTIFLDEIGDLDAACQVKLLRVLQDRSYEKLGSSTPLPLDVRVISATNRDLGREIAEGRFREDLFFRLNLIPLRLPPLRERPADIEALARHFLQELAGRYPRVDTVLDPSAQGWLRTRLWPGNVRQLRQTIERAVLLADGTRITGEALSRAESLMPGGHQDSAPGSEARTLEDMEQRMIREAIRRHAGNLSQVAQELGITRSSLYRRLEKYGLKP